MEATANETALGQHDTPRQPPCTTRHARDKSRVRYGLLVGQMDAGSGYITKNLFLFRRAVEAAVARQPGRGEIGIVEAALIQSALRWERVALLAQRYIRREGEKLDPSQRLAYMKATAECSSRRDNCLEKLGLQPGRPVDPWKLIIDAPASQLPRSGDQAAEGGESANEGNATRQNDANANATPELVAAGRSV